MTSTPPGGPRPSGPRPVQLPGAGTYGQLFPGDRPAPEFDHTFKFAPVGLFRKLFAMLLDGVIYGVLITLSYLPLLIWSKTWMVAVPIVVGLAILVFSILYLGTKGFTPGMRILNIRVIRHPEATPIGVGNAIVRYIVLNGPAALLSVIWYGLLAWTTTRDPLYLKRGWHDLAAQSVVHDQRENAPGRAELEERLARDRALGRTGPAQAAAQAASQPSAHQPVDYGQQGYQDEYAQDDYAHQGYESYGHDEYGQQGYEDYGQQGYQGDYGQDDYAQDPYGQQGFQPGYEEPAYQEPAYQEPAYQPQQPAPAAPPAPKTGAWKLSFDDGQAVIVTGFGLVGRDPEGKPGETVQHRVAMSDPGRTLSKTHASFELSGDDLVLIDRNSTNGVSVLRDGAETELSAGQAFRLRDADRVALGDRQVVVSRG